MYKMSTDYREQTIDMLSLMGSKLKYDLADTIDRYKRNLGNGHEDPNLASRIINSSRRSIYRIGEIPYSDGTIYTALKLYPTLDDRSEIIENELALFDFFGELGLPVPAFSGMVKMDGIYGTVTEDLTHNGEYELEEFSNHKELRNRVELLTHAMLEWPKIVKGEGFSQVPYGSLFIQIDENKDGRLVFADLDHLNGNDFSDGAHMRIISQFHDRYPNREYELVI